MSRAHLIQQAVRQGRKARIALTGPSGSGKTKTALYVAHALVPDGKMLVLDTERNSACLYSDEFSFDVLDWRPPYNPLELAAEMGKQDDQYDVIVVDSLTHFWDGEGGTLDVVDAAKARSGGNSYAGWKTGTPAQNALVESILQADCHVIGTMRSTMEYVLETNSKGQQVPKKVGMSPKQRQGIEYEFTVIGDLNIEHQLIVTKSRCSAVADMMYQPLQADRMGATLREWLDSAEPEHEHERPNDQASVVPLNGPSKIAERPSPPPPLPPPDRPAASTESHPAPQPAQPSDKVRRAKDGAHSPATEMQAALREHHISPPERNKRAGEFLGRPIYRIGDMTEQEMLDFTRFLDDPAFAVKRQAEDDGVSMLAHAFGDAAEETVGE